MRKTPGLLCAAVLLACTTGVLTGCAAHAHSAPPRPTRSASPTAAATASVQPDLSIRRSIALADGSTTTICVTTSVERDGATEDAHTDARLTQALAILTDPKWQTYPISLSQVPADEQQQDRAKGEGDAAILAGALSDAVSDAVKSAGLLGEGVSLFGQVGCR